MRTGVNMGFNFRGFTNGNNPRVKSGKISEILAIAHPRAVIVFTSIVLGVGVIVERGLPPLRSTFALVLAMAFIQIAIGVFNDYYDRDLDARAKPYRALPAGLVSFRLAYWAAWTALAIGLGTAAILGLSSMLVLALGAGMGFLYSARLKRSALSWLPYAIAYPIVPLWVWVSLGKFRPEMLLVYPVAIAFSLGVHLCNQLRDYDDDTEQGMKGLAQFLGKETASRICISLLMLGPAPALAVTYGRGKGAIIFLISLCAHWLLVAHCLRKYGVGYAAHIWRPMFKSLQLSGPLMLISWLLGA
jgi:4-hydroxybenzoate polyprenyltransferase